MQFIDYLSKPFTYYEVRYCLKYILNYSWRKANVRPPRSLRPDLEEDRIIFKEFLSKLIQAKFV